MSSALTKATDTSDTGEELQAVTVSQASRHKNLTLLAYGALALPWSLAGLPILLYLPAYYATELHLSAGLVGMVFLGARLWDGLTDILVGWFSDRTTSRFGRRKPWVMVGAPLLMASTWFLCNPPAGAGLVYLGTWAALFYTAATVVGIPYLSWGTELATDYVERSRVTAFREAFAMLGNLFFAAAPLLLLPADAPLQKVLLLVSVTVLWLVPLTLAPLGLAVRDIAIPQVTESNLLQGLACTWRDKTFASFLVAMLLIWISGGAANSLAVFALTVGLDLPNKLFALIFIVYIAMLLGLPATLRLSHRVEKHHMLAAALVIQVLVNLVLLFVPTGQYFSVAVIWAILGITSASTFFVPSSMLADIIDQGEVTDGERRSGTYVAIYNLVVKIGLAIGVGLSFGLLEVVGYDPSASSYSADDARDIRLLGFGLPGLLLLPAIVLILKYPITRLVQRRLRDRINRGNTGSDDPSRLSSQTEPAIDHQL